MSDHTPTPWKVFTTPDGRKLVGIGSEEGQGILDCGFGVWAWDDAEGIANAELVVKAVNTFPTLETMFELLKAAEPAMMNCPPRDRIREFLASAVSPADRADPNIR